LDRLIRSGRYTKKTNQEIRVYDDRHNRYRCNYEDRVHVKYVMLSDRRLVLSQDNNFIYDVNHFPRTGAQEAKMSSLIPYV